MNKTKELTGPIGNGTRLCLGILGGDNLLKSLTSRRNGREVRHLIPTHSNQAVPHKQAMGIACLTSVNPPQRRIAHQVTSDRKSRIQGIYKWRSSPCPITAATYAPTSLEPSY